MKQLTRTYDFFTDGKLILLSDPSNDQLFLISPESDLFKELNELPFVPDRVTIPVHLCFECQRNFVLNPNTRCFDCDIQARDFILHADLRKTNQNDN